MLRAGDLVLLVKLGVDTVSSRPQFQVISVQGRYVQLWAAPEGQYAGQTLRFLADSEAELEKDRIYLHWSFDGVTEARWRPGWTVKVVSA